MSGIRRVPIGFRLVASLRGVGGRRPRATAWHRRRRSRARPTRSVGFWVFATGANNQGYTLTVRDTVTNQARTYSNPVGTNAPAITDTQAFATCGS